MPVELSRTKILDAFKPFRNRFFSPFKDVQDAVRLDLLHQPQDILVEIFAGLYEFSNNLIEKTKPACFPFELDLSHSRLFQFKLIGAECVLPILKQLMTSPNINFKKEILKDFCELFQTEYLLFLCEYAIRNDFLNCNIEMERLLFYKLWSEIENPQNRAEIEKLHLQEVVATFPEQFSMFWDLVYHQRASCLFILLEREDLWCFLLETVIRHLNFSPQDFDHLENYLYQKMRVVIPPRTNDTSRTPLGPLFQRLRLVVDWLIDKHPVDPLKWYSLFIDWFYATQAETWGSNSNEPRLQFFREYFTVLFNDPGVSREAKIALCEILQKDNELAKLTGETQLPVKPPPESPEIQFQRTLAKNSLRALLALLNEWSDQELAPPISVIEEVLRMPLVKYHSGLQDSLGYLCRKHKYSNLEDKVSALKVRGDIFKGIGFTPASLQNLVDQRDVDQLGTVVNILADKPQLDPAFCPILTQLMSVISTIKEFNHGRLLYNIIHIFEKCHYYSPAAISPLLHLMSAQVSTTQSVVDFIMDVPGADFISQIADILKLESVMEQYLPNERRSFSYSSHEIQNLFVLIIWKDPSRLTTILKDALQALPNKDILLLQEIVRFLLLHPELEVDQLLDLCIGVLIACGGEISLEDLFYRFPRNLQIHAHLREYLSLKVQDPDFPVTIHTISLVAALNLEWPANRIEEIFSLSQILEITRHALQAQSAFQPDTLRERLKRFRVPEGWYRQSVIAAQQLLEGKMDEHTIFLDEKKYSELNYYEAIQTFFNLRTLRETDFPAFRAEFLRCIRSKYTKLKDDLKLLPEVIPPEYPRTVADLLKREEILMPIKVLGPLKYHKLYSSHI